MSAFDTARILQDGLVLPEVERALRIGAMPGQARHPVSQPEWGNGGATPEEPAGTWPGLPAEALWGLAGNVVRTVGPHTEADPAAVLMHLLTGFGSIVGRGPHFRVGAAVHCSNIFVVCVGATAVGRKGTALQEVMRLLRLADRTWATDCVTSGLSSGEGLVWAVRDPIEETREVREKGRTVDVQAVVVDEGVRDKRLFIAEGEFSQVLKVASREGNTLSNVLRLAWDSGDLGVLTKQKRAKATDAHVSVIGHITRDELQRYLTSTEEANGFANRFLWCAVRRSKLLPDGGSMAEAEAEELARRIAQAAEFARSAGELRRDEEARRIWHAVYPALTASRTGLFGAITSRAEAQTMRLALIYALLDRSPEIRAPHLLAGLAVWKYAEASARWIFGSALGDPVADEILRALRAAPGGLTRTEIAHLFGRHQSSARIRAALRSLTEQGLATAIVEQTDGRPRERWLAA